MSQSQSQSSFLGSLGLPANADILAGSFLDDTDALEAYRELEEVAEFTPQRLESTSTRLSASYPPPSPSPSSSQTSLASSMSVVNRLVQSTRLSSSSPQPVPETPLSARRQKHWNSRDCEVLVREIDAECPAMGTSNQDMAARWRRIHKVANEVYLQESRPHRSIHAMKQKWREITDAHKRQERISSRASGVIEFTTEVDELIKHLVNLEETPRPSSGLRGASTTYDEHRNEQVADAVAN